MHVGSANRALHVVALLTATVAGLDELHHSFLASRSGKVSDVALDSTSAVAVQFLILVQSKRRQVTSLPQSLARQVPDALSAFAHDLSAILAIGLLGQQLFHRLFRNTIGAGPHGCQRLDLEGSQNPVAGDIRMPRPRSSLLGPGRLTRSDLHGDHYSHLG